MTRRKTLNMRQHELDQEFGDLANEEAEIRLAEKVRNIRRRLEEMSAAQRATLRNIMRVPEGADPVEHVRANSRSAYPDLAIDGLGQACDIAEKLGAWREPQAPEFPKVTILNTLSPSMMSYPAPQSDYYRLVPWGLGEETEYRRQMYIPSTSTPETFTTFKEAKAALLAKPDYGRWSIQRSPGGFGSEPVIVINPLLPEVAAEYVQFAAVLDSFVGHADTAALLSSELGRTITPYRGNFLPDRNYPGVILLCQYDGPRLPEGATVLPPGAVFKYYRVHFTETFLN